jgi:hypothetical protein
MLVRVRASVIPLHNQVSLPFGYQFDWQGDNKSTNDGLAGEDQTRLTLTLGDGTGLSHPALLWRGQLDDVMLWPLSASDVNSTWLLQRAAPDWTMPGRDL